jgi:hypothetical protein
MGLVQRSQGTTKLQVAEAGELRIVDVKDPTGTPYVLLQVPVGAVFVVADANGDTLFTVQHV